MGMNTNMRHANIMKIMTTIMRTTTMTTIKPIGAPCFFDSYEKRRAMPIRREKKSDPYPIIPPLTIREK
jgi:hypothetical protein